MIGMVMAHPDFRPERLAGLTDLAYGASPMPAALLETLLELLPRHQHRAGVRHDRVRLGDHRARSRGAPHRRQRTCGRPATRCSASSCRSRTRSARALPTGRDGRGLRPGRQLHDRVLAPARGDGRGVPRRLVPHRRRRLPRRGRLPLPGGPGEGHDRDRRRERLLRPRWRTPWPAIRRCSRWRSSASPTTSGARRCTPSSSCARATTVTEEELHRPLPGVDRRVQGAEEHRVPHRAAAAVGGDEGAQARAA